jgi:hypothetical protein
MFAYNNDLMIMWEFYCFQVFNDLPSDCFKHNSESSLVHKEGLESKLLGRGGYGAVYRARLQNAVKSIAFEMMIIVKHWLVYNAEVWWNKEDCSQGIQC